MAGALFAKSDYEEASIDLLPGDALMAFTGGVPEALNPRDEEYGEERLRLLLPSVAHLPVEEMAAQIAQELKKMDRRCSARAGEGTLKTTFCSLAYTQLFYKNISKINHIFLVMPTAGRLCWHSELAALV